MSTSDNSIIKKKKKKSDLSVMLQAHFVILSCSFHDIFHSIHIHTHTHIYIRVQDEYSFYMILTRKMVSIGIWTPIHGYGASSLLLSYLTCWWMNSGHKTSVYQVQIPLFTKQLTLRNCHKITDCEQFWTKCCVEIVATLTLDTTDIFFEKMRNEVVWISLKS